MYTHFLKLGTVFKKENMILYIQKEHLLIMYQTLLYAKSLTVIFVAVVRSDRTCGTVSSVPSFMTFKRSAFQWHLTATLVTCGCFHF